MDTARKLKTPQRHDAAIMPVDQLTSPLTREGLDFWNTLRGDREMPLSSSFRPVEIPRLLTNVVLLDALWGDDPAEPEDFIYRVVGNESVIAHDLDTTGMKVSGLSQFGASYAKNMLAFYRHVCRTRAPVAAGGTMKMIGKDYRHFEVIYMPLSNDGTRVDRILAVVVYD